MSDYPFPAKILASELTKRELFAAMALQGILSSPTDVQQSMVRVFKSEGGHGLFAMTRFAIDFADALIAELAKEPK